MELDWSTVIAHRDLILRGFGTTILICAIAISCAIPIGVVLGLMRLSRNLLLQAPAMGAIEVIRNVPFMIQIFMAYFLLPFFGVRLSPLFVGTVSLSLYGGAYYAELVRGAILSVPSGQYESARTTGMSNLQAMRHIVFPQMLRYFIPPATNQATTLVKESAILSTITVNELTMTAVSIQLTTYRFFEVLIVVAILYWMLNSILSMVARGIVTRLPPA